MNKLIFEKINFVNLKHEEFNKIIKKNGLFVFPAAPALANIKKEINYYNSLKDADYAFFDSGFFVLLLKFFKKVKVEKFSGYRFLGFLFSFIRKKKPKLFLIDPNKTFSLNNKSYIKNLGYKKSELYSYVAPKYNLNNLKDKKLIKILKNFRPKIILINLGGGTQEVLGSYLRSKINYNCRILCTGAAISFFTGDQAPINNFIDKFYIGWLVRLVLNPVLYLRRFSKAYYLINIVRNGKIKSIRI